MSTNQPVAAKLIKKRQSYIKRLEAIYNLAVECQNHPSKLNLLRARAEDFPSICSSFETLHLDILACSDDDKQDEQHSLGNTFDEMKYVVHSLLRELLPPVDVVPKSGCKSNNHSFSELPSDDHDHDLDLPRIKVPVFSGNRRDWPAFYDLFRTLVHEKRSLSDIQRFQHLQMAVQGEAAELIRNIALTEANYPVAFNALIERFENKRALATDYWLAIYNAPPAKTHSAGDLRRLITTFSQNMEALNSLQGIDLWDFTKLNLLLQKIDPSLKTRFEIECSDKPIPRYGDLTRFLNKTCKALENSVLLNEPKVVSQSNSKQKESYDPNRSKRVVPAKAYMTNTEQKCLFCNLSSHPLVKCTKFIEAEVSARYSFVKQQHMCFNCFSRTHSVPRCLGTKVCKICSKKHHTLLHFQPINDVPNVSEVKEPPTVNATSVVPCLTSVLSHEEPTLFATAEISVYNISQDLFPCRAMLDCASVANFVTLSCVQQLALPITPSQIPIQGINNMSTASSLGTVKLKVLSTTGPCLEFEAIVVHSICENTPTFPINPSKWKHLRGLELADKNFAVPHGIDLLLGVPLFSEIILPGFRKSINGSPCAIKTIFGWILIGGNNTPTNEFVSLCTYVPSTIPVESPLDINLHKFWELEDVPDKVLLSPEEQKCEDFFVSTCSQKPDGRYVVRLPFKQPDIDLGDTRHQALRRFNLLENRLIRNPSLRSLYNDFMQDYLDQNHMIPCTSADNLSYYFPHHCVVKDDSGTTKIRVVFDGSSKGSNNLSLNDVLLPGPKLQNDIVTILLTFRFFPIVFSTDIRQMYRMIGIHEQDLKYQKILWRFDPSNPIQEYTLCTVTYGLNCSPYLAIRTLHQLAKDYGKEFPLARDILLKSTYVDDIIGLGHSVKGILELQKQLTDLLFCGGFELRKWTSNCKELLSLVPESHQHNISFNDNANCTLKILGLQWNPVLDVFSYSVKPIARECTKRVILSEIAKIYDPLGFVAPVVLVAKCLIQRLWIQGVGWDEVPTSDVVNQWQVYVSQLPLLSSFAIPRHVTISDAVCTELHGYCDASLLAYGGVLYMRQIDSEGNVHVNLLCAKSKVCPLKVLSVPRLETCAALLLSNLMHFVITNSPIKFDRIYAWSDSSVALYWIKSHPSRLKTFVANRVQQIQDRIPPNRWFHISGVGNPADCLSRSLLPKQLLDHPLWFNGPPWLKLSHELWPTPLEFDPKDNPIALQEERKVTCNLTIPENSCVVIRLLERFSSLKTVQHIVAYCIRFRDKGLKKRSLPLSQSLSADEIYQATCIIVKSVQDKVFVEEIKCLKTNLATPKPFRKLAPFLDSHGVVRVGGRLRHSDLPFDAKHPMLLPRDHRLTSLIIEMFHKDHGHPGPRLLQYLLRQQFWILSIGRAVNSVLSQCFRCHRVKPIPFSPFMSDIPKVRISQVKPFSQCGVDYMGPIPLTMSRRRGVQSQKGYICLFVCMVTKALHLEVASDLSSECFLAAFRRFVSRRGRCSDMYSDQGTNFVGASRMLLSYLQGSAETLHIQWHFNPPSAPHFGGLWEAGVKSVKAHLARVIGQQVLSFEEMSTVLAQCEAILNSRPLCEMSSNPNDLECLTPGHFLTMEALTAPPDEALIDIPFHRLKRWQLIQQLHQSFWKRWSLEYLNRLQQRNKWTLPDRCPKVGSLVVIKDNNQPPLNWLIGRLERIYSSPDNVPRVVQIRTTKGLLDRPLIKVCPLPSQ
ncbi:uncharacterized protein LOC126740480 [Anthonomus grandis grandis]|uniref:uncharacterized protein LOC126740480 n=1 Tax=Anthonomus grandis grandis TaxID=2921223 RepID=UPI00216544F0|nr:uncharacterized protein LOC126740480 [Anthonomus grandis grandis]XP_050302477.1 uncharacterized protein LOC126740480 [Anthonomus grandis grandis]XP_050302484.1 uncharacterized protein LOC126740480 [Anthonomus grandis grandis]XP_050302493.1 uncharacterized protein LOC126740480 [Anthonomus grandis grandis]XP_050302503.1 uncharacterized protein LOC126740480 [Anthonomus grandis grandis]XP_050302514.1 uncharacterized protein LOC126740480 [Anthonomus grandis grandis]XP_050302524.1 uncharacterize